MTSLIQRPTDLENQHFQMELAAFIIIITLAGPLIPTTQGLEAPGITSKYTKGRSISIRKNRTTTFLYYQKI